MSTMQNSELKPLIDLLIAAKILLDVKDTRGNPFVRRLDGRKDSEALNEAFEILRVCVAEAAPFYEAAIALIEENSKAEMDEINAEEQSFRDSS